MDFFVSVIIPNYNHARFLDERIQSVLNQTYQNFEVIILDDHSTDDSIKVIEEYRSHPKVASIIINDENSGSTFRQWNKGFELAKGDLIWIAESDDSCDVTLLERNVESFLKDDNCVVSFACSVIMDENGVLHQRIQDVQKDTVLDGRIFNQRYMYCGCFLSNASSALFKKDVAINADKSFMEYKGGGDRVFWMEIAECGNVAIINAPLNYFRKHGSNVTTNLYKDGTAFFEAKNTYDFIKTRYRIDRKESRRMYKYYIYRIKHVEHFNTEQIRNDLLDYWAPDMVVSFWVDLQWYKTRTMNYFRRIKRRIKTLYENNMRA